MLFQPRVERVAGEFAVPEDTGHAAVVGGSFGNGAMNIDVASQMLNTDGTIRKGLIGKDGVHMTPAGYDFWTDVNRSHLIK